jgi:hypothetical protein
MDKTSQSFDPHAREVLDQATKVSQMSIERAFSTSRAGGISKQLMHLFQTELAASVAAKE